MAEPAKDVGLLCPRNATLYACPQTETPLVGCCTTDPCEDGSGTCPSHDLVAATVDPSTPPRDLSHKCLGGEWYTCPDLEIPFAGCCSRDACLARCPVEDLRAAVLADYHGLVFNMASAETETEDAASAESTTARATSTEEVTHTPSSSMSISMSPTATDIPSGATSQPSPEKTVLIPDPHGKNNLSDTQEVGIGVAAGVIGFLIIGCIIHRIIVHIRKRRPGYPHRTDHDPDWRPPSSPIELNSAIAPGTRKCGLDRVPGDATRPGSWEDAKSNVAEAKLAGLSGPRRVRSADPGGLLDKASKTSEQGQRSGQPSLHSLPLPDVRGQPVDDSRRDEGTMPPSNKQDCPQNWVTGNEHAQHHSHYSDNGDFSVNIDGHGRNSHAAAAQARPVHSVDELRRHTAPHNPAARSDDQLSRFVSYPPAAEVRPAPRSEGAGRALDPSQYPLRTYQPYTPPVELAGQHFPSGTSHTWPHRRIFELEAEPVGEIRDPRARTTLGNVHLLNPDPARRESTVIYAEEFKEEVKDEGFSVKGDTHAAEEYSSKDGVTAKEVPNSNVKKSGENTLDFYTTMRSDCSLPHELEKELGDRPTSTEVLGPVSSAPIVSSEEEAPRLDATGGLPSLSPDNSRPTSTASMSFVLRGQNADATDALSDVRSEATRRSSPGLRNPSGLTPSSTAPNFVAPQEQGPEQPDARPLNVPRTLAVTRRRTSELHMDITAGKDPRYPSHSPMGPRPKPLDRQRQYPGQYVPSPRRDSDYGEQQDGQHGGRYSTYPVVQARTRPNSYDVAQRSTQNPRTAPLQPQQNHDAGQTSSQARQPYAQAHHTRVYYPHRANPPRPLVQPPPDTAFHPRRSAQDLGLGPQPQPAYRTFQGALDLNRGNDIARRDVAARPSYRPGPYSSAATGGYADVRDQYTPSVPRSEYSEAWEDDRTYGRGSAASSWKDFSLGSQQY